MNRMFHALRTWFAPRHQPSRAQRSALHLEILEDRVVPTTFQSLIGLDQVQSQYAYRGTGYTVALLDTGINYNLPSLGGGVGAGHRVAYGYNFLNNTTNALDDNGHGTFLANMIGSSDPTNLGIDPGVQFADLKVLDANMNGNWSAIDSALQWVIANKAQDNIVAINLSFGSSNYTTDSLSLLESDLATLKDMGVFISVASGNNFATYNSQPGLSYPAVDPDVVSVGATWVGSFGSQTINGATDYNTAANQIASYTQRDSNLSILAPGSWLTAIGINGTPTEMGGTSMATAVVTGAAVLLHQALDQTGQSALATEAGILQLMRSTGTSIVDNSTSTNVHDTGLTYEALNLAAAMQAAAQPATAPTLAPIANQTMAAGQTLSVAMPATNPAGALLTYTSQLIYLPALAYQLKQQYGLTSTGNYYTDGAGADEKWISGKGGAWFWILPSGAVYRYANSAATTLQPSNLLGTLDPTFYADPTKLWNAGAASNPPVTLAWSGGNLSIKSSNSWTGVYAVAVTLSDGKHTATQMFNVSVTPDAETAPTLAAIPAQTQSHTKNVVVTLNGSDADGNALTYSGLVLPVSGQTPPLSVSVQGNQLTVHALQPITGTFTIQATVSDGHLTASRTFNVILTNAAPALAAIGNQTLASGQKSLTLALSASDADNDPLSFQASVQTPSALAYQLNQQYAFKPANASYYFNIQGQNEKWLVDKNGVWYALLPTGQLYRWDWTIAQTLAPANLIGTLDPTFYTNPQLLWNAAPPVAPALTFSFQGNQLVLQRPATLTGVFFVTISVGDGLTTTTRSFWVTLN